NYLDALAAAEVTVGPCRGRRNGRRPGDSSLFQEICTFRDFLSVLGIPRGSHESVCCFPSTIRRTNSAAQARTASVRSLLSRCLSSSDPCGPGPIQNSRKR